MITNCNDRLKESIDRYLRNLEPCQREPPLEPDRQSVRKILLMNYSDGKGGAAGLCRRLFQYLRARGFDASMLVGKRTKADAHVLEIVRDNSEYEPLPTSFEEREGWFDFYHPQSFRIKQSKTFLSADVVHLHNLHKGYFSLLALPEITCLKPVVWTLHDMLPFTGHCVHSYNCDSWLNGCTSCSYPEYFPWPKRSDGTFLWNLKKTIYAYSDFCVVCPSKWLKSKVEKSILRDKRIELVYNGIDEKTFVNHDKRRARKRLGLPTDKAILLFVSSWGMRQKAKGVHIIPEVLSRLSALNVLFISTGNPEKDCANPSVLPHIDDEKELALYYAAADVFLLPTFAENCPLVVLEALSCGTPVVTFSVGGIPEVVQHKRTGYLADYLDIDDLVRGIRFFLDNPSRLREAGEEARAAVVRNFTFVKMAERYCEIYESCRRRFLNTAHRLDETYKADVIRHVNKYIP